MNSHQRKCVFNSETVKGRWIPVTATAAACTERQADTNNWTAFNYLEVKLLQCQWHMFRPTRLYQEDATTFCFQHKFLKVCFAWVQYLFTYWGLCYSFFYTHFQTNVVSSLWSLKCWNHWITEVVWKPAKKPHKICHGFKNINHKSCIRVLTHQVCFDFLALLNTSLEHLFLDLGGLFKKKNWLHHYLHTHSSTIKR